MRISDRSIEEVREAANIVEVASEFTALRRQGTRFAGLCPYPDHSEKTPSFSVSPDRGFYYCFGCQRGGDAIKLVSELKNFSFVDAVSYLAFAAVLLAVVRLDEPRQPQPGGYRLVLRDRVFARLAVVNVALIAVGWGAFTWLVPPCER